MCRYDIQVTRLMNEKKYGVSSDDEVLQLDWAPLKNVSLCFYLISYGYIFPKTYIVRVLIPLNGIFLQLLIK